MNRFEYPNVAGHPLSVSSWDTANNVGMPESACAKPQSGSKPATGAQTGLIHGHSTFPLPVRWSAQVEAKVESIWDAVLHRCTGHGGKRLGVDGHTAQCRCCV